VDITAGYNYQNSDQRQGTRTNLNGRFGSAQFDFTHMFAMTAEIDNYFGALNGQGERQQNFVLGPQFTFGSEKAKINSYAYLQGGDQRSSSGSTVEHAFNLQLGGGIQWKLNQKLTLQMTPFEYSLVAANCGLANSFGTKVGIAWTVWEKSNDSVETTQSLASLSRRLSGLLQTSTV
jgi:hypothetical protein